jgi:ornithine lipid ester-linked acyl 2-hydroxylase
MYQSEMTSTTQVSFPFLCELEEKWTDVLEELDILLFNEAVSNISLFKSHPETAVYSGNWDRFYFWEDGKKNKKNCELCPKTTELIKNIPKVVSAGLVLLSRESHIKPHSDPANGLSRCHLSLVSPDALKEYDRRATCALIAKTCGLRVEDEIYYWTPGYAFVFSDFKEWEAWNWGDRTCFVLEIDFKA